MRSQLLVVCVLGLLGNTFGAEKLTKIVAKTDECFQCGFLELFGAVNLKICGVSACCEIFDIDNDASNFQSGSLDIFEGQSLQGCFDFVINESPDDPITLTVSHSGVDGVQLLFVDLITDTNSPHCPINQKLDDGQFVVVSCLV